jgi:hypothetical protein
MRPLAWLARREHRLALVLRVADGILTALLLTANRLLRSNAGPVDLRLAVRVAVFTLASGAFTFFVARLTELRYELLRAERQLNIVTPGRLVATDLGRAARGLVLRQTAIASGASFLAALVLVGLAALVAGAPWLALAFSFAVLGATGAVVGRSVRGSAALWAGGLVLGGLAVTAIGVWLDLT